MYVGDITMSILVALDSFKGSMSSLEAAQAVKNGIIKAYGSKEEVTIIPVADGGEGTLEALTYGKRVAQHKVEVTGPLGDAVEATYMVVDGHIAIMEMAQAAGLTLVPLEKRNPLYTTTYGVGEMIAHGLSVGCDKFLLGIGGSATNDCGVGMLQALGFQMLDNGLKNVKFGAKGLKEIVEINKDKVISKVFDSEFIIACDVDNPLLGDRGCSNIFAPQKGATPEMVAAMEEGIKHFVKVVGDDDLHCTPGAGAAGGLGYAFLQFLDGKLMSGADMVIKETCLEKYIKTTDIIIVGEGKMDAQTTMGKIPFAIAKLAKKYNKKVVAVAGLVEDKDILMNAGAFDYIISVDNRGMTLEDAMKKENAMHNLEKTIDIALRGLRTTNE